MISAINRRRSSFIISQILSLSFLIFFHKSVRDCRFAVWSTRLSFCSSRLLMTVRRHTKKSVKQKTTKKKIMFEKVNQKKKGRRLASHPERILASLNHSAHTVSTEFYLLTFPVIWFIVLFISMICLRNKINTAKILLYGINSFSFVSSPDIILIMTYLYDFNSETNCTFHNLIIFNWKIKFFNNSDKIRKLRNQNMRLNVNYWNVNISCDYYSS